MPEADLIILMRHGESEANVNPEKYASVGDPNIQLTKEGVQQAVQATGILRKIIGKRPVFSFSSPYVRTRQTASIVLSELSKSNVKVLYNHEDPRIREREFSGSFQRNAPDRSDEDSYSRFFWRPPGGESCADVYDRISLFIDSLWRVFQCQHDVENGVVLIVSHGLAVRLFAMRWLHWSPETFMLSKNLPNCGFIVLEKQRPMGHGSDYYKLSDDSVRLLGISSVESESHPSTWPLPLHNDSVESRTFCFKNTSGLSCIVRISPLTSHFFCTANSRFGSAKCNLGRS
ncbi:hypothetical protein GUITHDRAFT_80402 [Guillardia theta CCMP2712]|uniref:Phosphoglycerate mutase n=1 Tax=Guillardia theta (strain CCMP2712) TaxID=905079 RepID=L1IFC7_GUITC|nr:hypothetical protein GUITHDRAFT_80402 [Guillardia theta CCMP2712]EKX34619.1 hypothetical protein GUITHDRAFT_80402 [Guillardia theta CCMP2712]|eukprot:XP_005821599.1 hypothetical protein GUITHDRAFT_80402 [Guillardia theta CCMP2712]